MELSNKARKDLREVLIKEIGASRASDMTEEDLEHIGQLLLTILVQGVKRRIKNERESQ